MEFLAFERKRYINYKNGLLASIKMLPKALCYFKAPPPKALCHFKIPLKAQISLEILRILLLFSLIIFKI